MFENLLHSLHEMSIVDLDPIRSSQSEQFILQLMGRDGAEKTDGLPLYTHFAFHSRIRWAEVIYDIIVVGTTEWGTVVGRSTLP